MLTHFFRKDIKKTLDILELLAPRLTPKVTPGGP